jgi:phage-related protein
MPDPTPAWTWCPAPGLQRASKLAVDINAYGDGYVHRSTRGLNPVRYTFKGTFPFTSLAQLDDMLTFLDTYALPGFYFEPPDQPPGTWQLVTCDEWQSTIVDRAGHEPVGTLTASFERAFNPQPISPLILAAARVFAPTLAPALAVPAPLVGPVFVAPIAGAPLEPPETQRFPLVPRAPSEAHR